MFATSRPGDIATLAIPRPRDLVTSPRPLDPVTRRPRDPVTSRPRAHAVQPRRHSLSDRVRRVAVEIPQGVMGVQVCHQESAVIGWESRGSEVVDSVVTGWTTLNSAGNPPTSATAAEARPPPTWPPAAPASRGGQRGAWDLTCEATTCR